MESRSSNLNLLYQEKRRRVGVLGKVVDDLYHLQSPLKLERFADTILERFGTACIHIPPAVA